MNARELLELAAMAYWAGDEVTLSYGGEEDGMLYIHADNQDHNGCDREFRWNPLNDDGDAFRLAMAVGINIFHGHAVLHYRAGMHGRVRMGHWAPENLKRDDLAAATRLAIVMAAAEVGGAL